MVEKRDIKTESKKEVKKKKAEESVKEENSLTKPGNRRYLSYYVYQDEWKPTRPLRSIAAEDFGPGPAGVTLPLTIGDQRHDPRKTKAPAYKFGERDLTQYESITPGPATYDTRTLTNKGRDECHAPVIGNKYEELVPFCSPGPAAYNRGDSDAIIYPHPPAYTMRPQTELIKAIQAPDPGAYNLPGTLGQGKTPYGGGPAYTIGERTDKTGTEIQNPGPAAYVLPPTDTHKKKPPAYSMGLRTTSQRFCTETPGPASNELHLVKFHKPATPRFSFGIRHSPYKAFQKFAAGD